jgi:hypothetical protein
MCGNGVSMLDFISTHGRALLIRGGLSLPDSLLLLNNMSSCSWHWCLYGLRLGMGHEFQPITSVSC